MIIFKLILEEQFRLAELQCHSIRTNIVDSVQMKINFPDMQAQEMGIYWSKVKFLMGVEIE